MKQKKAPEGAYEKEFDEILNAIVDCIFRLSNERCAEIYYQWRHAGWCDEFPEKPKWWDELPVEMFEYYRDTVDRFVDVKIGNKAAERYIHKKDHGYNDQEFDDMWDSMIIKNLFEQIEKIDNNVNKRKNRRNDNSQNKQFITKALLFLVLGILIGFFIAILFF